MPLIFFFFISFFASAKEIQVSHRYLNYKVNYTENDITYKGAYVELSLHNQPCSKHILKNFQIKMDAALEEKFLDKAGSDTYSITIDKIKKYDLLNSNRSLFFANFDDYFKSLKIEEILNCKKS